MSPTWHRSIILFLSITAAYWKGLGTAKDTGRDHPTWRHSDFRVIKYCSKEDGKKWNKSREQNVLLKFSASTYPFLLKKYHKHPLWTEYKHTTLSVEKWRKRPGELKQITTWNIVAFEKNSKHETGARFIKERTKIFFLQHIKNIIKNKHVDK